MNGLIKQLFIPNCPVAQWSEYKMSETELLVWAQIYQNE